MESEILIPVVTGAGVALTDHLIGKSRLAGVSTIDIVIKVVSVILNIIINRKK
ncbi:hypothetical protein ABMA75_03150 [Halobacteriovorax sp. ZH4_bin.1]|uniref:hypothetical protein n=1 Tax=unclassified Halobacteriovorax TaxID=2639665 RepID=UPI00371E6FD7